MTKRKIIIVLMAFIVLAVSAASVFHDNAEFDSLSLEDKLLYGKGSEEGERKGKTLVYWFEVDDGYVHAENIVGEHVVNVYHTNSDFSVVVGVADFSVIDLGEDYTEPLTANILAGDRYVNCFEHKEGLKVFADGKELELHNFTFEYEGKIHDIDMWYIESDHLPEITSNFE